MTDILGENPSVFGYFFLTGTVVVPWTVQTLITYNSTVHNIGCSLSSGIITIDKFGIYLIEAVAAYNHTPDGQATYLTLQVNDVNYSISSVEADVDNPAILSSRRRLESVLHLPRGGAPLELKLMIFTTNPGGITVDGYSSQLATCFRITRIR